MKFSNSIFVVAMFLIANALFCSSNCQAQMQRMDYEAGTMVEVEFMGQWHEAEVLELLSGGMMLRAKFTKRRGAPRDFMFPSMKVRELEMPEEVEATEETSDEDNPFAEAEESFDNPFATAKEIESDTEGNPFATDAANRRRNRSRTRENAERRQRIPAATRRPQRELSAESSERRGDGAELKGSTREKTPRRSAREAEHQRRVAAGEVQQAKSIGVWRWASFGGLSFVGIGLATWGFLNRSIYW